MAKLALSYFDIHGGRGETARIALHVGGIAFDDDRIPFASWQSRKAEMPYGTVPVLTVDGESFAQSNGINRYVGKLTGLYPVDPLEAMRCDEVMDAVEDVAAKVLSTFSGGAVILRVAWRDALTRDVVGRSAPHRPRALREADAGTTMSSVVPSAPSGPIERIQIRLSWHSTENGRPHASTTLSGSRWPASASSPAVGQPPGPRVA